MASPGGRSTSSLSSKEAEFQVMFNTGFLKKFVAWGFPLKRIAFDLCSNLVDEMSLLA